MSAGIQTRKRKTQGNQCRHRGHELLDAGTGSNARALKCPYHGWVYGLDGTLKGAPRYNELEGWEPAEQSLNRLRAHEWNGWVFVNMDPGAGPLGACSSMFPL